MNIYRIVVRLLSVALVSVALLLVAVLAQAQEESLNETFDDPSLAGWEHNENVSVAEGILHLESGGFAFHRSNSADMMLKIRARLSSGEGALFISYQFSETGIYAIRIEGGYLNVLYGAGDQLSDITVTPIPIPGSAGEWFELTVQQAGDDQVIVVDGEEMVSFPDNGFPLGGVGFEVVGGITVDIDSVSDVAEGAISPATAVEGGEPETIPEGAMFSELVEEFDAGLPADWQHTGEWRSGEGSVTAEAAGADFFAPGDWGDLRLVVRFRRAGANVMNVKLHATNQGEYRLELTPDQLAFYQPLPEGEMGSEPVVRDMQLDENWHDLTVQFEGGVLMVWLDDMPVFDLPAANPEWSRGKVGLSNEGGGRLEVDRLEINPPGEPVMAVEPVSPEPGHVEPIEPVPPDPDLIEPVQPITDPNRCIIISYAGTTVNVRQGPGLNYSVIGSVNPGEQYEAVGLNSMRDWYQIQTRGGQLGWVFDAVVSANGPCGGLAVLPSPGGQNPNTGNTNPGGQNPNTGQPNPGNASVDLGVADIYPQHLPQGNLFVQIRNHGPGSLKGEAVTIECSTTETVTGQTVTPTQVKPLTISIDPGQTHTFDTGVSIDTNQHSYSARCEIKGSFSDPNLSNNSRTKAITGGGQSPGPAPAPTFVYMDVRSTDLAVTDLFAKSLPQGQVFMRITNNGPETLTGDTANVSCGWMLYSYTDYTHADSFPENFTVTLNLKPGETSEHYTRIDIDTLQGWYDFSCTVTWINDPNRGNDTYHENFPQP